MDLVDTTGKPIRQQSFADTMVVDEVLLPHEEMNALVKVIWQSVDENGEVVGNVDENPMLDEDILL